MCVEGRRKYVANFKSTYTKVPFGIEFSNIAKEIERLDRAQALCLTSSSWPDNVADDVTNLILARIQEADNYAKVGKTSSASEQSLLVRKFTPNAGAEENKRIRLALGLPPAS